VPPEKHALLHLLVGADLNIVFDSYSTCTTYESFHSWETGSLQVSKDVLARLKKLEKTAWTWKIFLMDPKNLLIYKKYC